MSEAPIPPVQEAETNPFRQFKDELVSVADSAEDLPRESDQKYTERIDKQKNTIEQIGGEDLRFLMEMIKGRVAFERNIKTANDVFNDRELMRGLVFEMLCRIEYRDKMPSAGGEELGEVRKKNEKAAEQFMALQRNPPKSILKEVENLRNPDLIEIELDPDTDVPVIKTFVEATVGKLQEKKLNQLTYYEEDTALFLESLGSLEKEDWDSLNMPELRELKDKLQVSSNYEIIVLMSAEKDLDASDKYMDGSLTQEQRYRIEEMRGIGRLTLTPSIFGWSDVDRLADVFVENIRD